MMGARAILKVAVTRRVPMPLLGIEHWLPQLEPVTFLTGISYLSLQWNEVKGNKLSLNLYILVIPI
jgi:hypothetical protein